MLPSLITRHALALMACFVVSNALPLEPRDNATNGTGFVKMDFTVTRFNKTSTPSKRSNTSPSQASLTNQANIQYNINLLVGSQRQNIAVDLDTGSADLWFADSFVAQGGYSPWFSDTAKNTLTPLYISYGSGNAFGYYVKDTVEIPGGPTLQNLKFGDVTFTTTSEVGILGLGFESGESTFSQYPNFPVALKNSGAISKIAYSIFLNDESASTGSIIFGGIDKAKYESLATVPIASSQRLTITLNSLTGPDGSSISVASGTAPVLDTGSSIIYLPESTVKAIASSIDGASFNSQNQNIVISGSSLPANQYLTFNFANNGAVKIPLNDLVTNNFNSRGYPISGYALAITTTGSGGLSVLGDSFLRSAYVVFDLDDKTISIGQAKYTSDSDIVAIT